MDLQWGQTVFQVLILSVSKSELSLQKIIVFKYRFVLKLTVTPFRLGFFGIPWTGGGVKHTPPHFLKTIKGIDMKLVPLIKHRYINLFPLSYLSCDVT